MPETLIGALLALITGGGLLKLFQWIWPELKSWWSGRRSALALLDQRLDPLLKAAEELVGKLRHLAVSDFKEVIGLDNSAAAEQEDLVVITYNSYLIAQFWAQMQILRVEGAYGKLARTKKGKRLLQFIRSLEARHIRQIDRARQRGIGECIVDEESARPKSYYQFYESYCRDQRVRAWFHPLVEALVNAQHTTVRQELLVYGALVHAMVDTLDPKHIVTRDTPGWPNKLTKKSRRELRHRIFDFYLRFVKDPEKYCGK